jgi:lincosamide nucleotidyltransferase A/C/D/E
VAALAERQLAAIAELSDLLDQAEIAHWFFGGWGVDLLVGSVTRDHGDVDVVVWADDGTAVSALLAATGWGTEPDNYPDEGSRHLRSDVLLEVTYIVRDDAGAVRTPGRWLGFPWLDGTFGTDRGEIAGVSAPVISRQAMLATKTAFADAQGSRAMSAKDAADLAALQALGD